MNVRSIRSTDPSGLASDSAGAAVFRTEQGHIGIAAPAPRSDLEAGYGSCRFEKWARLRSSRWMRQGSRPNSMTVNIAFIVKDFVLFFVSAYRMKEADVRLSHSAGIAMDRTN